MGTEANEATGGNCTQELLYQGNMGSSRGISLECGGVSRCRWVREALPSSLFLWQEVSVLIVEGRI